MSKVVSGAGGVVGAVTASFGGAFLVSSVIYESGWGFPLLIGLIVASIVLIFLNRPSPSVPSPSPTVPAAEQTRSVQTPVLMTPPITTAAPVIIQPVISTPVTAPPLPSPLTFQPSPIMEPIVTPVPTAPTVPTVTPMPTAPVAPVIIQPVVAPMPAQIVPETPSLLQRLIQPTVATPVPAVTQGATQIMTLEEFEKWARQNDPSLLQFMPSGTAGTPGPSAEKPRTRRRPIIAPERPTMTPQPVTQPSPVGTVTQPVPVGTVGTTGSSLTPAEVQQMLDAHNTRRAKYGNQPLTWDPVIAQSAQSGSDRRAAMNQPMQHTENSPYGENLYWSEGMSPTPEDVAVVWIDNEAKFYDRENHMCRGGVCGHFTASISKHSNKLGCGRTKKGNEEYWTCQMAPYANMNMGNERTGKIGDPNWRAW